ncbi:MAG: pseudouridine synthase [Bacilli bacterium]
MERVQKVIAHSGYCSRRKAEDLILLGKVKVNGEIITKLGFKVNPSDVIIVEGKLIVREDPVYFIFNKPKGFLCSTVSEDNKPSIMDFFSDVEERIYPVGRLDFNTSGLLLLTNDGEFANLMMHPSYKIAKKYSLRCKGKLKGSEIFKLENGIIVDGYKTKRAKIKVKKYDRMKDDTLLDITIYEGRNQQIRKMFLNIGHGVKQLKRIQYGKLNLDGVAQGEYRKLKVHELKELYNIAKNGI